jgi:hypothetical protein
MQIRVGYELIYDCPQPTPMMLMLNIHHTRVSDIVIPDHLTTTPSTPITAYRDKAVPAPRAGRAKHSPDRRPVRASQPPVPVPDSSCHNTADSTP